MAGKEQASLAWIELQLLLLDNGAQIRNDVPPDWVWKDIEARLMQ